MMSESANSGNEIDNNNRGCRDSEGDEEDDIIEICNNYEDDDDGDSGGDYEMILIPETKEEEEEEELNNNNKEVKENEDDKYDDDDGDDDGINVIIDQSLIEQENLQKLLSLDHLKNMTRFDNDHDQNIDLEMQIEIENLIKLSISPSTAKYIAVLVNNQLILIPDKVKISDRLARYIWSSPKMYQPTVFPFINEFNKMLIKDSRYNDTFAIFAVRYNKTPYMQRSKISLDNGNTYHNRNDYFGAEERNFSVKHINQYCDFAAIIIKENKVIDYAIHGVKSNINEMILAHNPRRIYYNAKKDDFLDIFVNYPYQPFYEVMKNISYPVQIYHEQEFINTLPFCERQNPFCAFCRALKDVRGFLNFKKVPATVRLPQMLKDFILIDDGNNNSSNHHHHHHHNERQMQNYQKYERLKLQRHHPYYSLQPPPPIHHHQRRRRQIICGGGIGSYDNNNDPNNEANDNSDLINIANNNFMRFKRARNVRSRYRNLMNAKHRCTSFNTNSNKIVI
jgi:hypothetical protein